MAPKCYPSFLLFSFTYFPLAFTELVKDTEGNALFPGGKYYILPAISKGAGGGVKLAERSYCPVPVLQEFSEVDNGLPVHFSVIGQTIGYISTDNLLEIAFHHKKPDCAESPKWVLAVDGFPSPSIGIGYIDPFQGNFKIAKNGNFGYKLQYCPLFSIPPGRCTDIGRRNDEDGRRLVPTDENIEPFGVVFVHATANIKSVV
jgi:hypothetical protein